MKECKKQLVRVKLLTTNEEILCTLVAKDKNYYAFNTQYGPFTVSKEDIEYIDIIGEVKE